MRHAPRSIAAAAPLLLALLLVIAPRAVRGAEAVLEAPGEAWAGVPFRLAIEVVYERDWREPALPIVDGLTIVGDPSTSTMQSTRILNGRTSVERSVTISWPVVAERPGTIAIPSVEVVADGETLRTRPGSITVRETASGEIASATIRAGRTRYYVGETIDLELELRVRPYVDPDFRVAWTASHTWGRVRVGGSRWGPFLDAVQGLDRGPLGGSATPESREEQVAGDDGATETIQVLTLPARIRADRAGPLRIEPVTVLLEWPTRLARSRSLLSRGDLVIAATRPVVATAALEPIEILTPPEQGRPGLYRGAVGRFELSVTATPTRVAVGDPITLTISIVDRTPGGADLDRLGPPPLAEIPTLSADFRVPDEALAGAVGGRIKSFTTTVRARREEVSAIPPIPFVYFDPEREAYLVATSRPVPIEVAPGATLSPDAIEGAIPEPVAPAPAPRRASGLLANADGPALLEATPRFRLELPQAVAMLAAAPALALAMAVGGRIRRRRGTDRVAGRRRAAASRARQRLAREPEPAAVAAALRDYVADRTGAADGALAAADAIDRLRRAGAAPATLEALDRLLREAEAARYGGATGDAALADRAVKLLDAIEGERLR